MKVEEYVYPAYTEPLLSAYGGRFESVFVVLHPFVRVPQRLAWSVTRQYPDDEEILASGQKASWMEVIGQTGLSNCASLNRALLSVIGALDSYLADPASQKILSSYLQGQPLWMPVEGRFEPLLKADFLDVFSAAKAEEMIFVPEFPATAPPVSLSIESLRSGETPFPSRGTLLASDQSFLFTVDWDSFFTLFYGERKWITQIAAELELEGFFAALTTEHNWYNYSMGCATVTLSPEHWQTV